MRTRQAVRKSIWRYSQRQGLELDEVIRSATRIGAATTCQVYKNHQATHPTSWLVGQFVARETVNNELRDVIQ